VKCYKRVRSTIHLVLQVRLRECLRPYHGSKEDSYLCDALSRNNSVTSGGAGAPA
jgi:hypothetical protein